MRILEDNKASLEFELRMMRSLILMSSHIDSSAIKLGMTVDQFRYLRKSERAHLPHYLRSIQETDMVTLIGVTTILTQWCLVTTTKTYFCQVHRQWSLLLRNEVRG